MFNISNIHLWLLSFRFSPSGFSLDLPRITSVIKSSDNIKGQHGTDLCDDGKSLVSVSTLEAPCHSVMMHISQSFSQPTLLSCLIIFHASELCHSMGGFTVYSLFGIIQIIVKYFETFNTLFLQFSAIFSEFSLLSSSNIEN